MLCPFASHSHFQENERMSFRLLHCTQKFIWDVINLKKKSSIFIQYSHESWYLPKSCAVGTLLYKTWHNMTRAIRTNTELCCNFFGCLFWTNSEGPGKCLHDALRLPLVIFAMCPKICFRCYKSKKDFYPCKVFTWKLLHFPKSHAM